MGSVGAGPRRWVQTDGNIAIFPAVDTAYETGWTSWEYLGLYGRIVYGKLEGHEDNVMMVLDMRKNTATELSRWLRGY